MGNSSASVPPNKFPDLEVVTDCGSPSYKAPEPILGKMQRQLLFKDLEAYFVICSKEINRICHGDSRLVQSLTFKLSFFPKLGNQDWFCEWTLRLLIGLPRGNGWSFCLPPGPSLRKNAKSIFKIDADLKHMGSSVIKHSSKFTSQIFKNLGALLLYWVLVKLCLQEYKSACIACQ